jgi:hypothetical protein
MEFFDDFCCNQEKFKILEEYLSFAGPHVKKLTIHPSREVDPRVLQKLLDLFPNLESFETNFSWSYYQNPIKLGLKSTKIQRFSVELLAFSLNHWRSARFRN